MSISLNSPMSTDQAVASICNQRDCPVYGPDGLSTSYSHSRAAAHSRLTVDLDRSIVAAIALEQDLAHDTCGHGMEVGAALPVHRVHYYLFEPWIVPWIHEWMVARVLCSSNRIGLECWLVRGIGGVRA